MVNILSSLLITAIFAWVVYQRHLQGNFDLTEDYQTWGILFLIFIGVSIVARIIIQIVFHILNAIVTRSDEVPVADERDKMVQLLATRNGYYIFAGGFALSVISLAIGMPVYVIFVAFVGFGMIAEIVENVSQIYFYRNGV